MSQFYARYAPERSSQPVSVEKKPESLKRPAKSAPEHESKKRKVDQSSDNPAKSEDLTLAESKRNVNDNAEFAPETKQRSEEPLESGKLKRKEKRKKTGRDAGETGNVQEDASGPSKHTKVLSRFNRSRERVTENDVNNPATARVHRADNIHPDRAIVIHDLQPIPQPKATPGAVARPTYSTAPEWLRNPLRADQSLRLNFEEFGLDKSLLKNLNAQDKEVALPIQSAVIPLLLNKSVDQRSDLCVAAATGSGKTFSYVLPILSDLRVRKAVRLRAVVVVPTRALVKQVVQAFESCSSGFDIHLGTAEGSKTLAEEQKQLVEEALIYDPREYRRQQEEPVDWSTFCLDELVDDVDKKDLTANVCHITEHFSKVDVLVCTPGRLVEHLQSTRGFNLDDVQWFVADEADRLLNESYHEWLETVLPALKSQQATQQRDQLLESMYMDVPIRRVNKILLSATMTSDISQLLGLELANPRLVVVESRNPEDDNVLQSEDAEYHLPPRLRESAIAFKDSENKPLYLVELLTKHISLADSIAKTDKKSSAVNGNIANKAEVEDDTSSSGSSCSEHDASTGTSSSESSESESETDAGSVSSPSSSSSSSSSKSSTRSSSQRKDHTPEIFHQAYSSQQRVLIFVKSTEAAHRLSRLLSLLLPHLASHISTFTRSSSTSDANSSKTFQRTRAKILQAFTRGTTRILISTDLAARGLDVPHLENVVNYDVPANALTYVHRVGRTARAGESGHAWTLVEHRQGKWFWETIGGKEKETEKKLIARGSRVVQKVNLIIDKEQWTEKYEEALKKLGEDVRGR